MLRAICQYFNKNSERKYFRANMRFLLNFIISDNQIFTKLGLKTDEKYRRKAVKIGHESYDITM